MVILLSKYSAKTQNIIQDVLKYHFDEFEDKYEELYGCEYGSVQIIRIKELVNNFLKCGDYREGIARIQCTNPECKHEYFRPFSCKGFYLCPSCHQKRLLVFAEKLSDEVLLRLPHRQFVFTFPKMLRGFFRKDRRLYSDISRLIHNLVHEFYNELSKKEVKTGSVISYQSFGDFMRFNPHFHCIIMEGGLDSDEKFHHISLTHTRDLLELFRLRVLQYFVGKKLITRHLAKKLYSWKHSGFSIDPQ